MIPTPSAFIGIDWSGAKGQRQQGIQLACALPGNAPPHRIDCPAGGNWGRELVFEWLLALVRGSVTLPDTRRWRDDGPVLVGIDFSFAHPFMDEGVYYPSLSEAAQPRDPTALWRTVDEICDPDPYLYGGRVFMTPPWANYYLSPHNLRAPLFSNRRRATEHAAKMAGRCPSLTFKAIGADNVATGSMAGMRLLNRLKSVLANDLVIWPFDNLVMAAQQSALIIVEIFPSLYFHAAGFNPARNAAVDTAFLSEALAAYQSAGVPNDFQVRGSDADEADAIISAAALRYFAGISKSWSLPVTVEQAASTEGWIFGVHADRGSSGLVKKAIHESV